MYLLSQLATIDRELYIGIVTNFPRNFVFDILFSILSGPVIAGGFWTIIVLVIYPLHRKKDIYTADKLLVTVLSSIIIVDLLIKNIVRRVRPELIFPELPYSFELFKHSFSFPSGHSAVAFGIAYILSRRYRKMAILWYILAILVAFSRIYLEKHYPVDIIVGAIIGTLIGMLVEKVMVPKRLKKIYNQ